MELEGVGGVGILVGCIPGGWVSWWWGLDGESFLVVSCRLCVLVRVGGVSSWCPGVVGVLSSPPALVSWWVGVMVVVVWVGVCV